MSDFAGIMSDKDIHNLKAIAVDLQKYINEDLIPTNNMLSNDWRRIKDLLAKIANDQRKVQLLEDRTNRIIASINLMFNNGEVKK